VVYSLAVSVKMNLLLFAPGLLFLLLCAHGVRKTATLIALCALVQVAVGAPFLCTHPASYIKGAFDLSRVFLHRWSVNLKFLPEDLFVSRSLAVSLLAGHLLVLWVWFKRHLVNEARSRVAFRAGKDDLDGGLICKVLMTANFIGIVFARSLHFQFYVWYFHSLPALLWSCPLRGARGVVLRLTLWLIIEVCFNLTLKDGCRSTPVGPDCGSPMPEAAAALTAVHLVMLVSMLGAPPWQSRKPAQP